jgi:hypothetical protein
MSNSGEDLAGPFWLFFGRPRGLFCLAADFAITLSIWRRTGANTITQEQLLHGGSTRKDEGEAVVLQLKNRGYQ